MVVDFCDSRYGSSSPIVVRVGLVDAFERGHHQIPDKRRHQATASEAERVCEYLMGEDECEVKNVFMSALLSCCHAVTLLLPPSVWR